MNGKAVWADANLILAGRDRVAVDSLALAALKLHGAEKKVDARFMRHGVFEQVQIYYSAQLGLGQADPANIVIEDVQAPRLSEIKDNWK
jgi:uncharacterized protein (DUF362 family)